MTQSHIITVGGTRAYRPGLPTGERFHTSLAPCALFLLFRTLALGGQCRILVCGNHLRAYSQAVMEACRSGATIGSRPKWPYPGECVTPVGERDTLDSLRSFLDVTSDPPCRRSLGLQCANLPRSARALLGAIWTSDSVSRRTLAGPVRGSDF